MCKQVIVLSYPRDGPAPDYRRREAVPDRIRSKRDRPGALASLMGTRGSADARAGRALDARRLVASPTRPACARTATARGSGHAASSRHWHSTRRSSRRSARCPPHHRKRAARCRLLYWESGVAMATPVEIVDDAVLSGRTRTTNNHAIAATHQAADSNAALPRRERGAANAEAWRGDASRPLRAATAASTTPLLAVQRQGEHSFSNRCSPTVTGRVRVL